MQTPVIERANPDAVATTQKALDSVIRILDIRFGESYAKKNPALVAALVQTAAYNLRTHLQSGDYDELS